MTVLTVWSYILIMIQWFIILSQWASTRTLRNTHIYTLNHTHTHTHMHIYKQSTWLCALTPTSTEYINALLSWRAVHVIIKQTQVNGVSDRCWPQSRTEATKSLVVNREFTPQAKWLQQLGGVSSLLRLSFFPQLAANNIDKTP